MTKQEAFNNVIAILNGKGQSIDGIGDCIYFPDDEHPGCAIGCQPGFREKFGPGAELEIPEMTCIRALMEGTDPQTTNQEIRIGLIEFFGSDIPITFMAKLQYFHDSNLSWDDEHNNNWNKEKVAAFASDNDLEIPELTS